MAELYAEVVLRGGPKAGKYLQADALFVFELCPMKTRPYSENINILDEPLRLARYNRTSEIDPPSGRLIYEYAGGCEDMKLEPTIKKDYASDREVEDKRLVPESLDEAVLLFEHKYQNDRSQQEFLDLIKLIVAELKEIREQFR